MKTNDLLRQQLGDRWEAIDRAAMERRKRVNGCNV